VTYGEDSDDDAESDEDLTVLEWLMGKGQQYVVQGQVSGWGMGKDHKEVALYLLEKVNFA
jgi:hypothetical protein